VPQQPAPEEKGISRSSRIVENEISARPAPLLAARTGMPLRTRAPGELLCLALRLPFSIPPLFLHLRG
jgi:hypothetical protein